MNWITVFRFFSSLPWSPAAGRCQTQEGTDYTDRDQQFQRLNEQVSRHLKTREPVISVDLKKNVAIGPYQKKGREWRAKGEPEKVLVHDFIDPVVPKAIPYGVCDAGGGKECLTGKLTIQLNLNW